MKSLMSALTDAIQHIKINVDVMRNVDSVCHVNLTTLLNNVGGCGIKKIKSFPTMQVFLESSVQYLKAQTGL